MRRTVPIKQLGRDLKRARQVGRRVGNGTNWADLSGARRINVTKSLYGGGECDCNSGWRCSYLDRAVTDKTKPAVNWSNSSASPPRDTQTSLSCDLSFLDHLCLLCLSFLSSTLSPLVVHSCPMFLPKSLVHFFDSS